MTRRKNKPAKIVTSIVRRDFYRRLGYIAICVLPLWLFGSMQPPLRYIGVGFFIIGMFQVIMIIVQSQQIIDDFFPPKVSYEKVIKRSYIIITYAAGTLFMAALIADIFEIRNIDNTINGTRLFWSAAGAGILLAILVTIILKKKMPAIYDESERRYTIHFCVYLGFSLLSPAAASFINHQFSNHTTECGSFTILKKGIGGARSREYFVHLMVEEGRDERFSVGEKLYNQLNEGDAIELCIAKGKLGYDYVVGFRKPD